MSDKVPTLPSWADLQAIKIQHDRLEQRARQIRVGRLPKIGERITLPKIADLTPGG